MAFSHEHYLAINSIIDEEQWAGSSIVGGFGPAELFSQLTISLLLETEVPF